MQEKIRGKKLLILAGAPVHCKVVHSAREMGVHTIVTDYLRYEDSPAKQISDEHWNFSVSQVDEIVERCKKEKVDGVLNFCIDPAQRPYQKICESLGLYCYGTEEQFDLLTDKVLFKEFARKNDIAVIEGYSLGDVEKDSVKYPVFVKPNDSRGSRGQAVCHTKEEVRVAVENALMESSNKKYIIEQYMCGKQDFTMTYLVKDGKPFLVRMGDRYLGAEKDRLNRQCVCLVCPSKFSDLYLENVHHQICRLIRNLGIKNGPVFMQGFVDDDTIRFYDPGLRFPGGEYEALLAEATGSNLMKMLIEFALTGSMEMYDCLTDDLFKLNHCHTVQLPVTARPGLIHRFEGLDAIQRNKSVVSLFQRYNAGEEIPCTGDVRQRICEIACVVRRGESVGELVRWIQSKLVVENKDKESLLTSLVDPRLLDY